MVRWLVVRVLAPASTAIGLWCACACASGSPVNPSSAPAPPAPGGNPPATSALAASSSPMPGAPADASVGLDSELPVDAASQVPDGGVAQVPPDAARTEPVCTTQIVGQGVGGKAGRCASDSDCTILSRNCCGPCGAFSWKEARAASRDASNPYCPPQTGCPQCASYAAPGMKPVCRNRTCVLARRRCEPEATPRDPLHDLLNPSP